MPAYTAPSQIAQRQIDYFSGKHVLIAGEVEDRFALELADACLSVTVFYSNYHHYLELNSNPKVTSVFGAEFNEPTEADMVLLYWPKAKAEAEFLLAMLMAKLGPGTEIVVVGENRSGIKSIEKMFQPYGRINKYDSARRCSFYWGQCQQATQPFHIKDWFKSYPLSINGRTITIKSLPGVFSHGQLDQGTRLLLETIPSQPLSGKVLDFGCGAGVIGCVLKQTYPDIDIELCDINAYALLSTQETLLANGLEGKVFASDIYSNISDNYQAIVSNPPFHSGLDTNYTAAETLLGQAPEHLSANGELLIVANSFLKYQPILENAFGHYEVLNKTSKFTIYHSRK